MAIVVRILVDHADQDAHDKLQVFQAVRVQVVVIQGRNRIERVFAPSNARAACGVGRHDERLRAAGVSEVDR